ncbi:MAG TPA: hypothetical protein DEB39_05210 [Planctomycetaceae bacterium]|nr:hypothetical protein [Planctomycetaceae bacterium]
MSTSRTSFASFAALTHVAIVLTAAALFVRPATGQSSPFASSPDRIPDVQSPATPSSTAQLPAQPVSGLPSSPAQTPAQNPVQTPVQSRKIETRVVEPSLKDDPEAYRSVLTPGHPFTGLLDVSTDTDGAVRGRPLALYELLGPNRSPQRRRALLYAYWELAGQIAEYNVYLSKEQSIRAWHQDYVQKGNAADGYYRRQIPLLEAASKLATQERTAAALAVARKQYALLVLRNPAALVPTVPVPVAPVPTDSVPGDSVSGAGPVQGDSMELPIPSDYPLTGTYTTHIDEMRVVSQEARMLDRLLTIGHQTVQARHAAAIASMEFLTAIMNNVNDSMMLNSLLALDKWVAGRKEMIAAVVDYNKLVADYTSETAPGTVGLYPLLRALIKLPDPKATSAVPPAATNTFDVGDSAPGTFRQGTEPVGNEGAQSLPDAGRMPPSSSPGGLGGGTPPADSPAQDWEAPPGF